MLSKLNLSAVKTPKERAYLVNLGQPSGQLGSLLFSTLSHQPLVDSEVAGAEEAHAPGRIAVPACTSRLLVVGIERAGYLEVNDLPDIREVNSHSESIGRDHNGSGVLEGAVLHPLTHRISLSSMVGHCTELCFCEGSGDFLYRLAGCTVHDGAPRAGFTQKLFGVLQFVLECRTEHQREGQVRASKETADHLGASEFQRSDEVVNHGCGRSCSQGHHGSFSVRLK